MRRFYSMGEVEAITSLSRSTIYRKMAEGTFPPSVEISVGRIGWERRAVDEWCEGCFFQRSILRPAISNDRRRATGGLSSEEANATEGRQQLSRGALETPTDAYTPSARR